MRNSSPIHSVKNATSQKRGLQCIVLFLIVCQTVGCASMFDSSASKNKSKDKKKEGWSLFKKKEYQEPRSLVSTWTEDTLIQPGKPVTRGFGGRFYFYNDRSQVIPVDGELVVYGFEDGKTPEVPLRNAMTQVSPSPSDLPSNLPVVEADKKFRFTAEQFTQHFSQGDLGASYSVWIPWDAAGGPQRKITLIPCFVTKEGRTIRGDASKQVLSGKLAVVATTKNSGNPIQLASSNQSPNQSSNFSAAVQQASMNSMAQSGDGQMGFGQSMNLSNQAASSNMTPGMQPLGLNTTTIRVGPSSSLSGPMASQNQGFNNQGFNNQASNNHASNNQGLNNQGFNNSAMPSSSNMGYAGNVQYANNQGIQMPASNPLQSNSMPNNALPPMDPKALQPTASAAGNFHNPLNQTTLPPLGHNLPPTGWIGH